MQQIMCQPPAVLPKPLPEKVHHSGGLIALLSLEQSSPPSRLVTLFS